MERTQHTTLHASQITEDMVDGAPVYGPDDQKVGTVSHLHGQGETASVIVDVGGFLGMGAKPVALRVSQLRFTQDEHQKVEARTSMTKDALKDLPEHHH